MARRYPQEVHDFIRENNDANSQEDLAKLVTEAFPDYPMTPRQINCYRKNHKMPVGRIRKYFMKSYPAEVKDFILENYKGTGWEAMSKKIEKEFGLLYGKQRIGKFYREYGLHSGLDGQFKKGNISYNKGKHIPVRGRMAETMFKPGHIPANHKPLGYERVNMYGYVEVKVDDEPNTKEHPSNFVPKHRLVWEKEFGPIPEGYVVVFADGNKLNCSIDNLMLLSRKQLVRMNQNHLFSNDPELTRTGAVLADLMTETSRRTKETTKRRKKQ